MLYPNLIEKYIAADKEQKNELFGEILNNLNLLSLKPKIVSEADYLKALEVRHLLGRLTCYFFNNSSLGTKDAGYQQVSEYENVYSNSLASFNKKELLIDKNALLVAKYLAWSYYYNRIDNIGILKQAAKLNILRKEEFQGRTTLYVIGLKYKVGDNVFSSDSRGREHRCYVETIGRQAIPVTLSSEVIEQFINEESNVIKDIPLLHESYYVTWVGDGKGSIRAIPFPNKMRHEILEAYPKLYAPKIAA